MKHTMPPIQPTFIRRGSFGFTMMEMMVAIGITSVMMLLVNQVFNSATTAVKRGADTSTIVSNASTLSSQLFQDGKEMITALANADNPAEIEKEDEPGAFLVIVQQVNSGVTFPEPQRQNQPIGQWNITQDIRTDQLIMFREADKVDSMTPGTDGQYDSEARGVTACVWYGHAARPSGTGGTLAGTEPGVAPNKACVELVLGRRALIIIDESGTYPNGAQALSTTGIPSGVILADAGDVDAGGLNLSTWIYQLPVSNVTGDYDELWNGVTDAMLVNDSLEANFTFPLAFIEEMNISSAPGLYSVNSTNGRIRTGFVDALDGNELPTDAYKAHALSWGFPVIGERLLATQEISYPYTAEQVGRTHAYFIPYASDFAIDFAADITDDWNWNTVAPVDESAGRTWGGGTTWGSGTDDLYDGTPDTIGEFGPIKWYNAVDPNPDSNFDGIGDDPTKPVTWPIPSTSDMHTSGVVTALGQYPPFAATLSGSPGGNVVSRAVYVFGHTGNIDLDSGSSDGSDANGFEAGSKKWWPYLIRIRYRLHDDDGSFNSIEEVSNEPVVGKWFEQILPVPRK